MCSDIRNEICQKLQTLGFDVDAQSVLQAAGITVSQLLHHTGSFTVNFSKLSVGGKKDKVVVTLKETLKELNKNYFFLTGSLRTSCNEPGNSCLPGGVVLEDGTGSVPCLLKADYDIFQILNKDVFLLNWNYIVRDDERYIEVSDLVSVPLYSDPPDPSVSAPHQAVCVQDAAIALKHRAELKPGRLAVCGKVSAVSELFRMKSDHMFLVKLSDEEGWQVNLLVKRSDQLHWQTFLTPGREYVFTNLRPTTIQKGTVLPTLIYVVWEGSKFIPRSHWKGQIVSLKDWLQVDELHSAVDTDSVDVTDDEEEQLSTYTYQGTITDSSRSDVGIYQLDNKIGLYLSYVPSVTKFRSLRPGCTVTVYNTHHKGSPKPPKIRLVGCIQSCLKVTEFSPFEVTSCLMEINKRASLHLIHQYNINLSQFEQLLDEEAVLQEKLGSLANPAVLLNCLPLNSTLVSPWAGSRSHLEDFISKGHDCILFRESNKKIPSLIRLGDLCERLSSLENTIQSLREKFSHQLLSQEQLKEKLFWNYDYQEVTGEASSQALVGVIKPSKQTGQLQLVDNTGAIDVVVAPCSQTSKNHDCEDQTCCRGDRQSCGGRSHATSCPFLQTADLGSLISVDRYDVVTEQFLTAYFPSPKHLCDVQYIRQSRIQPYLMFSMHDVRVIQSPKRFSPGSDSSTCTCHNNGLRHTDARNMFPKGDQSNRISRGDDEGNQCDNTSGCHSHRGDQFCTEGLFPNGVQNCPRRSQTSENNQCYRGNSEFNQNNNNKQCLCHRSGTKRRACEESGQGGSHQGYVCKTFFLSQKESLMLDNNVTGGVPSLRFSALVSFVDSSQIRNSGNKRQKSCACDSSTCHTSELAHGQTQSLNLCDRSCRINAGDGQQLPETPLTEDKVLLVFQGETVADYHLLYTGHFYRLVVPSCDGPLLKPRYISATVKSAVEKFKATKCVVLPPSVKVQRVDVKFVEDALADPRITDNEHGVEIEVGSEVLERFTAHLGEEVCSVGELLSDSCKRALVSVRGVIRSRSHVHPETPTSRRQGVVTPGDRGEKVNAHLGVSTLENKCLQLEICDPERLHSLTVYMNLHKSSLPLGLLPGVWVKFSRLERRVSRIGTVYCQYIAVSTVRVIWRGEGSAGVPSPESRKTEVTSASLERTEPLSLSSFGFGYLGDLWRRGTPTLSSFYSICHVLQFLRLSFKTVCSQCGRQILSGSCTSAACPGVGRHLVARARVLVDDGSSTAIVSCQGVCVDQLLGLSPSQTEVAERRVTQHGELFIQQSGQNPGDLAAHPLTPFFTALCDSPVVKRQWKMYLSPCRYGPRKDNPTSDVDTMGLDDFSLKTINTGSTRLETRCLPFLQLDCVGVETVDATALVLQHLNDMES